MASNNLTTKYNLSNIFKIFEDKNYNNVYNINDSFTIVLGDTSSELLLSHYVTSNDETWQSISYRYYKTIKLWWLIAKVNDVTDAFIKPKLGDTINIVNPAFLNTISGALTPTN